MTDPSDGLKSFQQEIRRGNLRVRRAKSDSDLFVHLDTPLGALRYTYVRLEGKTVTALVMFAMAELGQVSGLHQGAQRFSGCHTFSFGTLKPRAQTPI